MNLETKRLILRNLRQGDLDDFHSFRSNPAICEFQSFEVFSVEQSRKFIKEQSCAEFGQPGKWVQVGLERKEDGRLIGDLALKPEADEPRIVEIGATLDIEYRKQGFAVEAFNGIFEYLFSKTETHRIFGILDVENSGSLRLVENLHFRREAELRKSYWDKKRNEWRDEYLYALLKEDWKSETA